MSHRFLLLSMIMILVVHGHAAAQEPLTTAPNDPRFSDQWAAQQIGLECAWTHTTGSPNVTVAVIDSGVDLNHPDLVDALRDDGFNAVDRNSDPTDRNGHGTHVAGIIAATINNGANLLNVNSFWQRIITGALIIVIVYFDGLRRRRGK